MQHNYSRRGELKLLITFEEKAHGKTERWTFGVVFLANDLTVFFYTAKNGQIFRV